MPKRKIARLLSLLLSLIMVAALVPITASANQGFTPVTVISAAGGGGSSPGVPKAAGTGVWSRDYQGLRISIIGHDGTPAFTFLGKNHLDLLFSDKNLDSMDYYGDGAKTETIRNVYQSANNLNTYRINISDIQSRLLKGSLTTAVPNGNPANAIARVSTSGIPRPLDVINGKFVGQGRNIKSVFYGSGSAIENDALIYVIANLKNENTGKWMWQIKEGAFLQYKPFTDDERRDYADGKITPIKLMEQKGMYFCIEPIIWNCRVVQYIP